MGRTLLSDALDLEVAFDLRSILNLGRKDSSCQTGPLQPINLLTLRAEAPLISFRVAGRPKGHPFLLQRWVKEMDMFRHYYCSVELISLAVIVETMLKNYIPGRCSKRRRG